jgi:hypothetical protein
VANVTSLAMCCSQCYRLSVCAARVTELITKLGLDKVASTQIGFMSAQSGRRFVDCAV